MLLCFFVLDEGGALKSNKSMNGRGGSCFLSFAFFWGGLDVF